LLTGGFDRLLVALKPGGLPRLSGGNGTASRACHHYVRRNAWPL
jgi:hypothetical protein